MTTQPYSRPQTSVPSWPNVPPPFPGAPPIPAGFNISPQQWNYGVWKPNPAFNPAIQAHSSQQFIPWAAAPAWQQYGISQQSMAYAYQQQAQQSQAAHQQQASYNPYKRIPKPPSEDYYKTQLSDNPLGLENMVPADDIIFTDRQPQTPWLWQPRGLDDDSAPESISRTSSSENSSSSRKQSRQAADPQSSSPHRRRSNSRRSAEPPSNNVYIPTPPQPPGVGSSYTIYANASASRDALPSFDRPLDRPRDPNYGTRRSSSTDVSAASSSSRTGLSSASASAAASSSMYQIYTTPSKGPFQRPASATPTPHRQQQNQPQQSPAPEPYTSKAELKPTFSTKIIRTPDFYQKKTLAGGHQSSGSTESMAELAARLNRLDTSSAPPVARHSSLPQPLSSSSGNGTSILGSQNYAEEPSAAAAVLSPLAIPLRDASIDPPSASRGMARHATVPILPTHALSAIPEAASDRTSSPAPTASRAKSPPPIPVPPPVIRPASTSVTPASSSRRTSFEHDYGSSISRAPSRGASRPPSRSASRAAHVSTSVLPSMPNSQHTSPTTSLSSSSSSLASTSGASSSSRSSTKLTTPPSTTMGVSTMGMGVVGAGAGAGAYWPTGISSASASASAAASGSGTLSAGSKSARVYYAADEVSPTGYSSGTSGYHREERERDKERKRDKERDRERVRDRERDRDRDRDREHIHHHHHHHVRENGTRSRGGSLSNGAIAPPTSATPAQNFLGQFPPPRPYNGKLRQGFWNSRGDHLTQDGYVVYAPPNEKYPEELRDYPKREIGYLDETGRFAPVQLGKEELRESLPIRGKPAKRPYDSFKKYITVSTSRT